jgi:hypothetical protein
MKSDIHAATPSSFMTDRVDEVDGTRSAPFGIVAAMRHIPVKRGVRPVAWCRNQAVFDRVVMDIFHVAPEILLVPDCMFPKPPLPDSLFLFPQARGGREGFMANAALPRKGGFDKPPPGRKITVTGRQSPEAVDMIGQHHHGIHQERMSRYDRLEYRFQQRHLLRFTQKPTPSVGHYGKKIRSSRRSFPSVLHQFSSSFCFAVGFRSSTQPTGLFAASAGTFGCVIIFLKLFLYL